MENINFDYGNVEKFVGKRIIRKKIVRWKIEKIGKDVDKKTSFTRLNIIIQKKKLKLSFHPTWGEIS